MSFSLSQLLLLIVAYLSGLLLVAHLAERQIIPPRITRHPAIYVLSLGVFAGAMATNGVFDLAHRYGFGYLLYYLGVTAMFVVGTVILLPLLRLCRVYQLSSIADVLSFRFRSQAVGATVTVAMCLTLMPLLALQVEAVTDSVYLLIGRHADHASHVPHRGIFPLLFCVVIAVFTISIGTRRTDSHQRNNGLVTAIAFESLVKLMALTAVFFAAVFQVFGGFAELNAWLESSAQAQALLEHPVRGDTARTLLLLFFAGAVCMPHIFHMAFAENNESLDLRKSTWGLPLYLLLLALPVLPITWAAIKLNSDLPMDFASLAVGQGLQSTSVTTAAFLASLSAASATIIVTTIALANMCLTHLILPRRVLHIDQEHNIYRQLRWSRRGLIALLIWGGYGIFVGLRNPEGLANLGMVAFTGSLQFLPGVIAALYWPGANRRGLLAGLLSGLALWFAAQFLPLITDTSPLQWLAGVAQLPEQSWTNTALLSLAINTSVFILVSLLTPAAADEKVAAEICSMDNISRPVRQSLTVHSAAEFVAHLAAGLGENTARAEVHRALQELRFDMDEKRPYALRRLRNRIEANLSGLLGPAVAHNMINRCIPFQSSGEHSSEDINLIERNLDHSRVRFTGLAADLNNLRRHYRDILNNLPIGICTVGSDGELLMWNRAMERVTGIHSDSILGSHCDALPAPWQEIFAEFLGGDADTMLKKEVPDEHGSSRWISLQKAAANPIPGKLDRDQVVLIEDITEFQLLEQELLHSERLASIGRLAAGVAHEIGNPVTGIACLAQNLEYETEPQAIQETGQDILKQTERVSRIVESLVNFSHVGSGAGDIELGPCNLADCIDEAIHLLRLDTSARPIVFNNHCDRELVVTADSQRLLQVFVNLLGNARDASAENAPVDVHARPTDSGVSVAVEDWGCGIPAALQTQVFEPFYTTKDPGQGTGLGLALVYSIMEDMGGTVQLESPIAEPPAAGTRFTLLLQRGSYGNSFQM